MAVEKLQAVAGSPESMTPTARFERGELTVDAYLEALVSDSVRIVANQLPADRVEWLRGMLRDQLVSDPVIRERVRQATGRELHAK
jgi:hypothetical protein